MGKSVEPMRAVNWKTTLVIIWIFQLPSIAGFFFRLAVRSFLRHVWSILVLLAAMGFARQFDTSLY